MEDLYAVGRTRDDQMLTASLAERAAPEEAARLAEELVDQPLARAGQFANDACERALSYVREQPGRSALITFGAGLGLAMLFFRRSRSQARRLAPAMVLALSTVARKALQESRA